jgi:hypothetical protein
LLPPVFKGLLFQSNLIIKSLCLKNLGGAAGALGDRGLAADFA